MGASGGVALGCCIPHSLFVCSQFVPGLVIVYMYRADMMRLTQTACTIEAPPWSFVWLQQRVFGHPFPHKGSLYRTSLLGYLAGCVFLLSRARVSLSLVGPPLLPTPVRVVLPHNVWWLRASIPSLKCGQLGCSCTECGTLLLHFSAPSLFFFG